MTRTNHDQEAKQYLTELLTPLGDVEPGREVAGWDWAEIDEIFAQMSLLALL